tara:strand:+ start:121 stop:498 length:378 start_codon:yes stop_codon:yes gene_type:complete
LQDPDHFVTFEDLRPAPGEGNAGRRGFESVFCRFAESLGHEHITDAVSGQLSRAPWGNHTLDDGLRTLGLVRKPVTIEELQFLFFLDVGRGEQAKLSCSFYALQAVSVLIHLLIFEGPLLWCACT